jgi:phosphoribosylglycinamide formyltransferase-1/phosphoribosylamine--glycine ligase/phosphoribosylglycinamide formyltransferase/phosphoribosylformylglycinamidine cyclo-ligase
LESPVLSSDPGPVLERIRELCLALPQTGERLSHGIPAFDVAGKMFAYFRHDHHGDGRTVVCVKTAGRDEQEMLIEADPDLYSWPAYIGPSGWISINLARDDTNWAHVSDRLRASYRLAAPRRLAAGGLRPSR